MKYLSIIIPVYNVGLFLERCILSLEEQDIPKNEYEIICINDGSTDNSREIIKSFQDKFGNVRLIDQENKGVSIARNLGIENAVGEYVLMIDGDDYIKPCVLGKRISILKEINPEIAYAGHILMDENSNEVYRFDPVFQKGKIVSGIEFVNNYLRSNKKIASPHSSVSIFISRIFLEKYNLRYLEGVPYLEDGHFLARLSCLAERVILINDPIYIIAKRPGSATNSNLYFSDKAKEGFLKAAKDLIVFREGDSITIDKKTFLNHSVAHFVFVYLISNSGSSYLKKYWRIKEQLKKGPLVKLKLEGCSPTYRNMARFYNHSIHLFYLYWSFYKLQRSFRLRIDRLIKKLQNG